MNRAVKNLASSSGELVVLEPLGLTFGEPVVLNDKLLDAVEGSTDWGVIT